MAAILFLPAAMKGQNTDPEPFVENEAMHISKSLQQRVGGDQNSFLLTLDAFVDGNENVIHTETKKPLDIVLVLDASAAMSGDYADDNTYWELPSRNYSTWSFWPSLFYGDRDTQYYFKHTDGKYYPVHVIYEGILAISRACIYYKVGSDTYYIMPDGTLKKNPNRFDTSYYTTHTFAIFQTIFTGVLYRKANTKAEAMQTAVGSFINTVYQNATADNLNHKISIVKFAGNDDGNGTSLGGNTAGLTEVLINFTDVKGKTSEGASGDKPNTDVLQELIDAINIGGSTSADYGLNKASLLLNQSSVKNDGAVKVVVMFTYGEPNHPGQTGFNESVANNAISISKSMKDNGVIVYTIGVLDNPSDDMKNYMNYVSSNYPSAQSLTISGSQASDKYYLNDTGGTLNDIFKAIAETSIEGGATYPLDATTVLRDVVSDDFIISGDVVVKKVPFTSKSGTTYTFNESNAVTLSSPAISVSKSGKTVNVSGFDFAGNDNWVGYVTERGSSTPHGYKLSVTIPLQIDPNSDGGANVNTNTSASGLYDKADNQVARFNYPKANIPNIIISKTYLKAGESALFNVYKKTGTGTYGNPIQVWVTGDGTENAVTTTVKYLEPGTYKVEETGWSWSYTAATTQQEKTIGSDDNTTFSFTNTPKTGTPAHGEAATGNNVFAK